MRFLGPSRSIGNKAVTSWVVDSEPECDKSIASVSGIDDFGASIETWVAVLAALLKTALGVVSELDSVELGSKEELASK